MRGEGRGGGGIGTRYISRRSESFGLLERVPPWNRATRNYIIGLYVVVDRDNSNFIFKSFFKINSFVRNLYGIYIRSFVPIS